MGNISQARAHDDVSPWDPTLEHALALLKDTGNDRFGDIEEPKR